MNVNLTIIVQAINFFIAYGLLSRFLLKPALQALDRDNAITSKLKGKIVYKQDMLAQSQEQKKIAWQHCREHFQQNRPKIEFKEPNVQALESSLHVLQDTFKSDFEPLTEHIVRALKEKVIHG